MLSVAIWLLLPGIGNDCYITVPPSKSNVTSRSLRTECSVATAHVPALDDSTRRNQLSRAVIVVATTSIGAVSYSTVLDKLDRARNESIAVEQAVQNVVSIGGLLLSVECPLDVVLVVALCGQFLSWKLDVD